MLNRLKQELAELAKQMHRREKIDAMLGGLRREEQALVEKEQALRTILSSEEADVARLERMTATSILLTVLGRRELRLEQEQQEAYAAKLNYGAALRQLSECRRQIDALQREREPLDDGTQYQRIYQQILTLLKEEPTYAVRLYKMEQQLGESTAQLREISEAIAAGDACLSQIECVEQSLDKAEGWGTWDLLFSGGMLSDLAKHGHLDEAQSGIEHLQHLLSRFHAELADVKISAQLEQVQVEGFLRFADYFFDGLLVDWCVLSHIHESQQRFAQLKEQLGAARSRLRALHAQHEQEKTALEQQMDALVHSARQE